MIKLRSALAAVAALAAPCLAAAQAAAPQAAPALAPSPVPSVAPTAIGLFILLALVPAAIWAVRRFGAGVVTGGSGGLRVVAQLGLGPRERLVVVEAGDRCLVLAVSPAGIQRVGTMARDAISANPPARVSFANLLKNRVRNDSQG